MGHLWVIGFHLERIQQKILDLTLQAHLFTAISSSFSEIPKQHFS